MRMEKPGLKVQEGRRKTVRDIKIAAWSHRVRDQEGIMPSNRDKGESRENCRAREVLYLGSRDIDKQWRSGSETFVFCHASRRHG